MRQGRQDSSPFYRISPPIFPDFLLPTTYYLITSRAFSSAFSFSTAPARAICPRPWDFTQYSASSAFSSSPSMDEASAGNVEMPRLTETVSSRAAEKGTGILISRISSERRCASFSASAPVACGSRMRISSPPKRQGKSILRRLKV